MTAQVIVLSGSVDARTNGVVSTLQSGDSFNVNYNSPAPTGATLEEIAAAAIADASNCPAIGSASTKGNKVEGMFSVAAHDNPVAIRQYKESGFGEASPYTDMVIKPGQEYMFNVIESNNWTVMVLEAL